MFLLKYLLQKKKKNMNEIDDDNDDPSTECVCVCHVTCLTSLNSLKKKHNTRYFYY